MAANNETPHENLSLEPQSPINNVQVDPFRQTLWQFYNNNPVDMCTLRASGGREFNIPRLILTSQSEIFRRMLEDRNTVIDMEEYVSEVISVFVEYLFRGTARQLNSLVFDLNEIAHRYGVESLKSDCAAILGNSLEGRNLNYRLILAFENNNEELKQQVFDYIQRQANAENYVFSRFLTSDQWLYLLIDNRLLAREIIHEVSERFDLNNVSLSNMASDQWQLLLIESRSMANEVVRNLGLNF